MPPKVTPKTTPKKPGNIAGIPKWGWIVGAAIGLIIGYMLIRNSSASGSTGSSPAGSGGTTSGSDSQQASGNIPWDEIIKALGLRGGGGSTTPPPTSGTPTDPPGSPISTEPPTATPVAPGVDPSPTPSIPAGAPGSPEYLTATTGMASVTTPSGDTLVGMDAKMAHADPSAISASAIRATQLAEGYAHTAAVQAAGTWTAGF